jgi:hypothetical protein
MWPNNHIDLVEDSYKSLVVVYYEEANVLVSMVKVSVETPFRMGGSWSVNENEKLKVVI